MVDVVTPRESKSPSVANHIHCRSSYKISRLENTDALLYYAHSHYFQNIDEDFLYYGEITYTKPLQWKSHYKNLDMKTFCNYN